MPTSPVSTATPAMPINTSRRAVPALMSRNAAFYLQASVTFSFLAGSSAPTAVYPLYQAAWGLSSVTITIIFGIYALAVLASLLVVGRLSDHVGRRPVLLVSAIMQVLAMVMLGTAHGVSGLLVGRVIQGLSTGAAVAAVGAGLVDIDKVRGTIANSIAPIMGTATGGLVGGLLVHFLPAPTHLVYAVLGATFALQAIGLVMMPETISPRAGALASLKPQFAVPAEVRGALLLAVPVFIAAWALVGFYAALGPALVKTIFTGLNPSLFSGFALFVMAGSGALAVLGLHRLDGRKMMGVGAAALLAGVLIVVVSLAVPSVALFLAGTAVAGAGFGTGFQGGIRMVMPLAAPHQRAGVLSVAFVVCYIAMGVPAIVAGSAIAQGNSIPATAYEFAAAVMLLSAIAALGGLRKPAVPAAAR